MPLLRFPVTLPGDRPEGPPEKAHLWTKSQMGA